MKNSIIAAAILALTIPAVASAGTWVIDREHSNVGFKVRHMMVSNVKGQFASYDGTVQIDDKDLSRSRIEVAIDTASIDTGVAKRDEHLKSADFFDVAKHPKMTFVSKKVTKAGKDRLKVTGDLTLHGVTREVVLDVEGLTGSFKDPWGNVRRGATATAKINRKDFGLSWNANLDGGGVVVGEDVAITLEVELLQK